MREIIIANPAKRFLKKLVEKPLKDKFKKAIYEIAEDPDIGEMKKGNLHSIHTYGFSFQKTEYRIAYSIGENDLGENFVVILLTDKRERFYEKLSNYLISG